MVSGLAQPPPDGHGRAADNRLRVAGENAPKGAQAGPPARPPSARRHRHRRPVHELRKAAKHARYAGELATATGLKGASGYVKRAKKVQDILGEHQDAVVAAE